MSPDACRRRVVATALPSPPRKQVEPGTLQRPHTKQTGQTPGTEQSRVLEDDCGCEFSRFRPPWRAGSSAERLAGESMLQSCDPAGLGARGRLQGAGDAAGSERARLRRRPRCRLPGELTPTGGCAKGYNGCQISSQLKSPGKGRQWETE